MQSNAASRSAREAKVKALWRQRRDPAPWAAALAAAPARAARPSAGARLAAKPELDEFYFERLPQQLLLKSPSTNPLAALTNGELAAVVEWKLARGTWRPRLLDFAKAARQSDVAAAAAAAAEALEAGEVGAAVDALCVLKGVGPATATALLSAADPSIPFLSDEALVAVLGAREYSKPAALRVTEALRERAAELNEQQQERQQQRQQQEGEEKGGSVDWTASKVERALWSASRAEDDEKEGDAGEIEEEASVEKKKKRKLR